ASLLSFSGQALRQSRVPVTPGRRACIGQSLFWPDCRPFGERSFQIPPVQSRSSQLADIRIVTDWGRWERYGGIYKVLRCNSCRLHGRPFSSFAWPRGEIGLVIETLRFELNVYFLIRQQVTAVAFRPLSFINQPIEPNRNFHPFRAG